MNHTFYSYGSVAGDGYYRVNNGPAGASGATGMRNTIHVNPNFNKFPNRTQGRADVNSVHINPNFLRNGVLEIKAPPPKVIHVNPKLVSAIQRQPRAHESIERGNATNVRNLQNPGSTYNLLSSKYSWSNVPLQKAEGGNFPSADLKKSEKKCQPNHVTPYKYVSRTKLIKNASNKPINSTPTRKGEMVVTKEGRSNVFQWKKKLIKRKSNSSMTHSPASKYKYVKKPSATRDMSIVKMAHILKSKYKLVKRAVKPSAHKSKGIISRYKLDKRKRRVSELSRNKFKVDKKKPKHPSSRNMYKIDKRVVLRRSRYKLQKLFPKQSYKAREVPYPAKQNQLWMSRKSKASMSVVTIGGILYKTTTNSLRRTRRRASDGGSADGRAGKHIVHVRGEKFVLESNGKTLRRVVGDHVTRPSMRRVDIGGVTFVERADNVLSRTETHRARHLVAQAKNRSIAVLTSRLRKNNIPCPVFRRLGRCTKKQRGYCPFAHDPRKVAVCLKFLKGCCKNAKCLLSHDVVAEKMATCRFYLNGLCHRENCPYPHVKVSTKAGICVDFLQGFCSLGRECKKRHVNTCPEMELKGRCRKGKRCPYSHVARKTKARVRAASARPPQSNAAQVQEPEPARYYLDRANSAPEGPSSLPKRVRLDTLPAFIPLAPSTSS